MKAQKEDATPELSEESQIRLLTKFRRFLAEGGAGRSNTNELLAAIVEELVVVGRLVSEERKKPSSK